MNPNAALANLRQALEIGDTIAAAQAGADLDEWLGKGGFLPKAWQPKRPVIGYQELDPGAKQVRDAAIAARHGQTIDGQTADGRPYKILPSILTDWELYPKTGVHAWNAWPILAIETGGYNDLEVTDPYTGRCLWVGEVWDGSTNPDNVSALPNALRRVADTIEQSRFMDDEATEVGR